MKKESADFRSALSFASHNRACTLSLRMLQYLVENVLKMKRRISFMKLGIVESEPVSETLRKRTNADKA